MVIEARRAYNRAYYLANRERVLATSRARYLADPIAWRQKTDESHRRLKAFMRQQKEGKVCVRCGFSDPRALDFHHRDASGKEFSLARAWQRSYSRQRILAEIAKCEVLCANCHRIMHAEEREAV